MRRDAPPRSRQPDLLVREPCRDDRPGGAALLAPDPVAALAELADLLARGLIARADLEAQVAKVLGLDLPAEGPTTGAPSCAGRRPPLRPATRRRACDRSS
jgi:hypothetical protein